MDGIRIVSSRIATMLAAVIVLALAGCSMVNDVAETSCGEAQLINELQPEAGGGDVTQVQLATPYLAVMGTRLDNGNQVAQLVIKPTSQWQAESMQVFIDGPVVRDYPIDSEEFSRLGQATVTIGTPGEYTLAIVGDETDCRNEFMVEVVLDTVLRSYDIQRGLSEPPPPDMQDSVLNPP